MDSDAAPSYTIETAELRTQLSCPCRATRGSTFIVITASLTCRRSVKLNEGRQRKVKNISETNESQSGARLFLPVVRGKIWGKVNFRPPKILVTY
jgi:hypothetical protein